MAQTECVIYSIAPPLPEDIVTARLMAGHTQSQAAACVHRPGYRSWQNWERGTAQMPADTWELYLLKTGQHPVHTLRKR
jgi:hypothetical protein